MADINQRISEIAVKFFNDNNVKFAERLKTSEANIRNYKKSSVPKIDFLIKLRDELEISFDWLLTGKGNMIDSKSAESTILNEPQGDYQLKLGVGIPLVDKAALGGIGNSVFRLEEKDIISRYVVPEFQNADFMMRVNGPSMEPKYFSGDIVACKVIKEPSFIQWNRAHVIATVDQGILIKRIKKGKDEKTITAISENKDYDPFEVPWKEITGIALVVGTIRLE